MAWIAIDAGTSVIKVVAFNSEGAELALCRESTIVLHPHPAYSEQSMEAVWLAVIATVQKVVAQLQGPVHGIAVTAQGDGCWLVDEEGNPVGNAILWNDGRATAVAEAWRREGLIEKTFPVSGSVPYAGLTSAIFRWLEEHEPLRLRLSRYALSCNGWIFSRLTGQIAADLSDASNPFCDVVAGTYSDELLQQYGVANHGRLLPGIARGKNVIGSLLPQVAALIGVPADTPVVMAPYDIVTTAYGAGVTQPGQACVILGTTICAETIVSDPILQDSPTGTTIALDGGLHLRAMPTLTGCETLEWARELLAASDLEALEALASKAAPGARGLVFLPYLSPAGERAPFLEPSARGSLHGMSLNNRREDVARSFYEGLSFGIRECLQAATNGVSEVRVCGGGARSDFWCQMIADVIGLQVLRPEESELGARGAFLFAMTAVGELENLQAAANRFPVSLRRFVPSGESRALYENAYQHFLEVRDHVRQLWGEAK